MRPLHLFTALAGAATALFGSLAYTNNGNPPTATTGAPGQQNCSRCHGSASTNASRFQLLLTDTSVHNFTPGQTVTLRAQMTGTTVKNGFEVTALKATTTNAAAYGTLVRTDAVNTNLTTASSRQYIRHTTSGNQRSSWDFSWTAPASTTDTNSVYFYACGVASNNNNRDDAGDAAFLAKLRLRRHVDTPTAMAERVIVAESVQTFPNPCTEALHIRMDLARPSTVVARLYNTAGVEVMAQNFVMESGKQTIRWSFDRKPAAGTYILRLFAGGFSTARTVSVE